MRVPLPLTLRLTSGTHCALAGRWPSTQAGVTSHVPEGQTEVWKLGETRCLPFALVFQTRVTRLPHAAPNSGQSWQQRNGKLRGVVGVVFCWPLAPGGAWGGPALLGRASRMLAAIRPAGCDTVHPLDHSFGSSRSVYGAVSSCWGSPSSL